MDLRAALNLANLSTPAGVLLALAGGCRIRRGPSGLLLAGNWRFRLPAAAAFTVGNVVLHRERVGGLLSSASPAGSPLLAHEARHSTQYAVLGPAFLPLYFAAAGWSVLRTGNPGTGNVFERLAGLADGGYPTRAPRRQRAGHSLRT